MHFKNHVGKLCRLEMNPDNNRCAYNFPQFFFIFSNFQKLVLDNINTEAAEQCFSWLKKYASIISSMNWLRAPTYLVLLFHYKNLSNVHRKPTDIFPVVRKKIFTIHTSIQLTIYHFRILEKSYTSSTEYFSLSFS